MHVTTPCQAVLHAELPHLPTLEPIHHARIPREARSRQELRSLIQIQYSFLRDQKDYVYNPSALSEYYSYDPWKGLITV